jgi:putative transposase
MGAKRYTMEQIIAKLRAAEIELAKGQKTPDVCRKLGISEQTDYRWRREYGGLQVEQVKRLKQLERENARLKKVVADQALDIAIMKEASSGKF